MTRFEQFLHGNHRLCWWLKFIVVVLMVVWAGQLDFSHCQIPTDKEMEAKRTNPAKMSQFVAPIQDHAAKLYAKHQYSPEQFFADKKAIQLKDIELGYPSGSLNGGPTISSGVINHLHELLDYQLHRSVKANQEYDRLLCLDAQWEAKHGICTGGEEIAKIFKKIGGAKLGWWFIIFWLRLILLTYVFCFIRMIERKGILQTVLAEPVKLLLPLVPPYAWVKYPANVVREIVVEAELRRLGKFFRWLSPEEKERVREIANSSNYKEWMADRKRLYRGIRRRHLVWALVATVLINLTIPVFAGSTKKTDLSRGPTAVIYQTVSGDGGKILYESPPTDHHDQIGGLSQHWTCLSDPVQVSPIVLILWTIWADTPPKCTRSQKIDHVPDCSDCQFCFSNC